MRASEMECGESLQVADQGILVFRRNRIKESYTNLTK